MSESIWSEGEEEREEPFTDGNFGFEEGSGEDDSFGSESFWDENSVDDLAEPDTDYRPSSIPILGQLQAGIRLVAPGINMAMDLIQYGARNVEEYIRDKLSGRKRFAKEEDEEPEENNAENTEDDEPSVFFD